MEKSLMKYVVETNGKIDEDKSIALFKAELKKLEADNKIQGGVIADAIATVFKKHSGKALTLDFLTMESAPHLNVQNENYKIISDRIRKFVRDNTSKTKNMGGIFGMARGSNGGGTFVWADRKETVIDQSA
jgi:hypothetical protein